MQDYNQAKNSLATERAMSRIDNDVTTLKGMIERVEVITSRVVRHTRTLGYFEPPSDAKAEGPQPVITTLADAINALDRALDHCSGSLNVFD